jgi:hypothetical protein
VIIQGFQRTSVVLLLGLVIDSERQRGHDTHTLKVYRLHACSRARERPESKTTQTPGASIGVGAS